MYLCIFTMDEFVSLSVLVLLINDDVVTHADACTFAVICLEFVIRFILLMAFYMHTNCIR